MKVLCKSEDRHHFHALAGLPREETQIDPPARTVAHDPHKGHKCQSDKIGAISNVSQPLEDTVIKQENHPENPGSDAKGDQLFGNKKLVVVVVRGGVDIHQAEANQCDDRKQQRPIKATSLPFVEFFHVRPV